MSCLPNLLNLVPFFFPFSFFCLALAFWNHTWATLLCTPALLAIFSMAWESGFISLWKWDCSIWIWSSVKHVRGRLARGFVDPSLLLVSVQTVSAMLAPVLKRILKQFTTILKCSHDKSISVPANAQMIWMPRHYEESKVNIQQLHLPRLKKIIWLSNISILSVDEGYYRNASCALNISTFLLLSLGWYLCWWTISPEGIIRPVVSVSALTWFIIYISIEMYSS